MIYLSIYNFYPCCLFLHISKSTHKKLNTVSCTFTKQQSGWHVTMYWHLFTILLINSLSILCLLSRVTNFFFTVCMVRWSYRKNIPCRDYQSTGKKFCFFIIYALQKLHMQYQSFPAMTTNYIFTNNRLKEAPNPRKLININIRLAAFTAAKFTKILLADSCTWFSTPMFQRWTCLIIWVLAWLNTQSSHWPCVGWPKRILLNIISFSIHYVH